MHWIHFYFTTEIKRTGRCCTWIWVAIQLICKRDLRYFSFPLINTPEQIQILSHTLLKKKSAIFILFKICTTQRFRSLAPILCHVNKPLCFFNFWKLSVPGILPVILNWKYVFCLTDIIFPKFNTVQAIYSLYLI